MTAIHRTRSYVGHTLVSGGPRDIQGFTYKANVVSGLLPVLWTPILS